MSDSMILALLGGLAFVGFVVVSLKLLVLQFKQWQMQSFFKLFITEPLDMVQSKSGSGGGFLAFFGIVLMVIFIVAFAGSF